MATLHKRAGRFLRRLREEAQPRLAFREIRRRFARRIPRRARAGARRGAGGKGTGSFAWVVGLPAVELLVRVGRKIRFVARQLLDAPDHARLAPGGGIEREAFRVFGG